MAYKLHELEIVPNGLNLAPPADQVAKGDCLALTGWWPSSVGKLQQARGWTSQNLYPQLYPIHSISEAEGRIYYADRANLYQQSRDAGNPPLTIDTGYDSHPLGLLGFQGFMYIMNRGRQRRDDGVTCSDWAIEVPAVAPGATTAPTGGSLAAGDYDYYVTFIDADLNESNPSPVFHITTAGGDVSVNTITRPSATPNPTTGLIAILRWNVYRKSPLTSQIYKLNFGTILSYATASYNDYGDLDHAQTDEDVIGNGEVMEDDHDAAPAARCIGNQPFNDRLIVGGSDAYPNRIWYTKANQPAYFPTLQYLDVGADRGDEILGISVKKGFFFIYRQRSIWWHVGDFDDPSPRLEPLVPDKGTVGQNSWCSTSDGDYFVWKDGVYHLTDWAKKVSRKIQPVFERFDLENHRIVQPSSLDECALGIKDGRLWFCYIEEPLNEGDDAIRQTLVYDVETERWFGKDGSSSAFGIPTASAGQCCFYQGSEHFYAGSPLGLLNSLEDGTSDGAGLTPLAYQSAYEDCGFPDHEKTWGDLVINHCTQGVTLTVTIRTNNLRTFGGVDSFVLTTISSASLTRQVIPLLYPSNYATVALRGLPIKSLNLSVRIEGYGPAGGFAWIDTPILLHYYLEARKGVSFDSGITNHGTPGVKTVDAVEIDLDASEGAATLQIWSDIPGNVMVVRLGAGTAIAATTGRQVRTIVLASALDGRLFRYQVNTTTGVQIYGIRARVLSIGTFVDGAVSDVWDTEALAAI